MTAIDLSGLNTDAQKTALIESSAANSAKLAVAGESNLQVPGPATSPGSAPAVRNTFPYRRLALMA